MAPALGLERYLFRRVRVEILHRSSYPVPMNRDGPRTRGFFFDCDYEHEREHEGTLQNLSAQNLPASLPPLFLPPISLPPISLPPIFLPPIFLPPIFLPP